MPESLRLASTGVGRIMNKDDVKITEADFFKNVPADQSQSVLEVYRVKVCSVSVYSQAVHTYHSTIRC